MHDVMENIPQIPRRENPKMEIIVHTGSEDIRKQRLSEVLKQDFLSLLDYFISTSVNVYTIHQAHVHNRVGVGKGRGCFSGPLGLNTWLAFTCAAQGMHFKDNILQLVL